MLQAGEGNFWISLIIMVVWVVSAIMESKRKKQIQRQKEERARMQTPSSTEYRNPAPKPIEVSAEDPRSIQEILEDVLWKEHHQEEREEHEGSRAEHDLTPAEHMRRTENTVQSSDEVLESASEHIFSAEEHVANEGQRSSKLLSADQLAQIREAEIAKLNREMQRPVGHASMQSKLPSQIFPRGIPQVIVAAEILNKPRSMKGRYVR